MSEYTSDENPFASGDSTDFEGSSYDDQMDVLQDPWPEVRVSLASSPHCDLRVLESLACDTERWVRVAVAQNPIVTEEILDLLCADRDEGVARHALGFAPPDDDPPGIRIEMGSKVIHLPPTAEEGCQLTVPGLSTITFRSGSWFFGPDPAPQKEEEPPPPKTTSIWGTIQKAALAAVAERAGSPLLQALADPEQLVAAAAEKAIHKALKS